MAHMIQYGKERRAGWLCTVLSISSTIYERTVREYRLYLPGKACEYNIQIMEERQKYFLWDLVVHLSGCRPLNIVTETAYAKGCRCLPRKR